MGSCGGRFGQEEDYKEDKEENNTQEEVERVYWALGRVVESF